MKPEEKIKSTKLTTEGWWIEGWWIISISLVLLVIIEFLFLYNLNIKNNDFENKIDFYKRVISLKEADYTNMEMGDNAYEKESLAYEEGNYKQAIFYCEEARNYWLKYTQELREQKEEISLYEEDIFKIYAELIESEIRLYNNMYEACEYYESACRRFDYYYLPGTPFDDRSFDDGNRYIKSGNEKIAAHDLEVEVYNTLLITYQNELKKITEE